MPAPPATPPAAPTHRDPAPHAATPGQLHWLEGELRRWEADGLVDEGTARTIRARYVATRRLTLSRIVLTLGACFVGLGVVWLVASNLDEMPPALRFGLLVLVWLGLVAGAEVLATRRDRDGDIASPVLGAARLLCVHLTGGGRSGWYRPRCRSHRGRVARARGALARARRGARARRLVRRRAAVRLGRGRRHAGPLGGHRCLAAARRRGPLEGQPSGPSRGGARRPGARSDGRPVAVAAGRGGDRHRRPAARCLAPCRRRRRLLPAHRQRVCRARRDAGHRPAHLGRDRGAGRLRHGPGLRRLRTDPLRCSPLPRRRDHPARHRPPRRPGPSTAPSRGEGDPLMTTTPVDRDTTSGPVGGGTRARRLRVLGAVLASLVLLVVAVWQPLAARLTGEEIALRVEPIDPLDPFRGAYVDLGYPDLPGQPLQESGPMSEEELEASGEARGTAYVPLRQQGEVWVGGSVQRTRPSDGVYLTCDDSDWRVWGGGGRRV